MRTAIIIVVGLVLLGAGLILDKWLGAGEHMTRVALLFTICWLAVALLNMWFGVEKAGYSVREEFPIFLVIFLIPAAVALFIAWRFSR